MARTDISSQSSAAVALHRDRSGPAWDLVLMICVLASACHSRPTPPSMPDFNWGQGIEFAQFRVGGASQEADYQTIEAGRALLERRRGTVMAFSESITGSMHAFRLAVPESDPEDTFDTTRARTALAEADSTFDEILAQWPRVATSLAPALVRGAVFLDALDNALETVETGGIAHGLDDFLLEYAALVETFNVWAEVAEHVQSRINPILEALLAQPATTPSASEAREMLTLDWRPELAQICERLINASAPTDGIRTSAVADILLTYLGQAFANEGTCDDAVGELRVSFEACRELARSTETPSRSQRRRARREVNEREETLVDAAAAGCPGSADLVQ